MPKERGDAIVGIFIQFVLGEQNGPVVKAFGIDKKEEHSADELK